MRSRHHLSVTLSIWGRELGALFATPRAYILMTVFLAINGSLFYLYYLISHGHPGLLVQAFFGQSFFFWLLMLLTPALLTMHLLAEERQRGTLELLLSTPVTIPQILLGKYLAGLSCFMIFWGATALLFVGAWQFNADLDSGVILAGYLGTWALGAFFIALGLYASVLSNSQIVAATLSLLFCGAIFGLYFLRDLFSQFDRLSCAGVWYRIVAAIDYLSPVAHFKEFSRGVVDTRYLGQYLLGTLLLLYLSCQTMNWQRWHWSWRDLWQKSATRPSVPGSPPWRLLLMRAVIKITLAVLLWALLQISLYHCPAPRWDLTRSGIYTLSAMTHKVLARLKSPVTVYMLAGRSAEQEHVIAEAFEKACGVLQEYARACSHITLITLSQIQDPTHIAPLAQEFKIDPREQLFIFTLAQQRRYRLVRIRDLAEFYYFKPRQPDLPWIPTGIKSFRAEQVFTDTLLGLLRRQVRHIYFTSNHGEISYQRYGPHACAGLAQALRRRGYCLHKLDLFRHPLVPTDCTLLIIAGPRHPFRKQEAYAVHKYLQRGGHALVLLDPLVTSGLANTLRQWGIVVMADVVLERLPIAAGQAWGVTDEIFTGYFGSRTHPAARGLRYRVLLRQARSLRGETTRTDIELTPLVLTEAQRQFWSETNLRQYRLDPGACRFTPGCDQRGPLILALVSEPKQGRGYRLAVVGDADFITDQGLSAAPANTILFYNLFHWLVGQENLISLPPREAHTMRWRLTPVQQRALWWFWVVVIPASVVVIGIIVALARRDHSPPP